MLDFAASEFIELSHRFGLLLGQQQEQNPNVLGDCLCYLLDHGQKLGLQVTIEQLFFLIAEINVECPGMVKLASNGHLSVHGKLNPERSRYYVECLQSTMLAEIRSIQFKAIPRERSGYCDPKWLFGTSIQKEFPNAWAEIQLGGKCFAYGESTACAFHLNRCLEWGLKSLAVHLGRRFDRNSWEKHLEDIDKELTARHTAAGARSSKEKFYSELAVQFHNMKVAWRNPTMHIGTHYDEGQAAYLLAVVEKFVGYLADNGLRESPMPVHP